MARTFECRVCGDPYKNPTSTGRPPVRCVNCAPATWSEEDRARALARRRELEALEARVKAAGTLAVPPAPPPTPPVCLPLRMPTTVEDNPRLALALAVRHVGRAEGRNELAAALHDVQRVVRAWLNAVV